MEAHWIPVCITEMHRLSPFHYAISNPIILIASSDVLSDDLDSDEDDDDLSPDADGGRDHDATNPAAVAKARRNRPHGPVVNK